MLEFIGNLNFDLTSGEYLVARRVQQMWPRKPRSLEDRFPDLDEDDRAELERYERFARAWGAFTNLEHFTPAEDRGTEFLREGLRLVEEALRAVPDYPFALAKRSVYRKALGSSPVPSSFQAESPRS